MKKFLINVLTGIFLILILSALLNATVYKKFDLKPAAGNTLMNKKYNELIHSNYNLIALGSSKIYRQFDVPVFDSICKQKNINAFNMGVEGTFPPETYYLLEQILQSKTNLQYVLLEVRAVDVELYPNWHTLRAYYWYNISRFKDFFKLTWWQEVPLWRKTDAEIGNIAGLADQNLNLGKAQFILNEYSIAYQQPPEFKKNKGFVPYTPAEYILPKDTSQLSKMALASEKAFKTDFNYRGNNFHFDYLMHLKKLADSNHIQLIFVLSDNQKGWMYKELIPLFKRIDSANKIIVSDATNYPALYWKKNKANITHLNAQGAKIYTTHVAEDFMNINK